MQHRSVSLKTAICNKNWKTRVKQNDWGHYFLAFVITSNYKTTKPRKTEKYLVGQIKIYLEMNKKCAVSGADRMFRTECQWLLFLFFSTWHLANTAPNVASFHTIVTPHYNIHCSNRYSIPYIKTGPLIHWYQIILSIHNSCIRRSDCCTNVFPRIKVLAITLYIALVALALLPTTET